MSEHIKKNSEVDFWSDRDRSDLAEATVASDKLTEHIVETFPNLNKDTARHLCHKIIHIHFMAYNNKYLMHRGTLSQKVEVLGRKLFGAVGTNIAKDIRDWKVEASNAGLVDYVVEELLKDSYDYLPSNIKEFCEQNPMQDVKYQNPPPPPQN